MRRKVSNSSYAANDFQPDLSGFPRFAAFRPAIDGWVRYKLKIEGRFNVLPALALAFWLKPIFQKDVKTPFNLLRRFSNALKSRG